jgi:hypothetical protein
VEPINLNSLTKTNTLKTSEEDFNTPFSFLEWSNRTSLYKQEEAFNRYNEYLQQWFASNKTTYVSPKFKLRQKYLYLLDQLKLTFDTKDKNEWYKTIDLADENELLLSIPFFARKLKNVALYYLNTRKKVKRINLVNNSKGSSLGLEQTVKDYILNYFTEFANEDSNSSLKIKQTIDSVKNKLVVQIEEMYDDGTYLDMSPTVPISEYVNPDTEDINFLNSKNINFSFLENLMKEFNIDVSVDHDTFVSRLTGNLFEITTKETYEEFVNKYIGAEKIKVVFEETLKSSFEETYNVLLTEGNNFFYYPYGTGALKGYTQQLYETTALSSIDFKTFIKNAELADKPTAGTSLEDSDIIITRAGDDIKAAWLYYEEYEKLNQTPVTMLFKANEITTFRFPYPGYGLSGFNVNWTGPSHSYTPNFNFLTDDTRNAILDAYWNYSFAVDKTDPIKINECAFAASGATASIHPQHADRIYITDEKSADPTNPFIKPAGVWLYKNTHSHIPLVPDTNNLLLWPYMNLTINKTSKSDIIQEINEMSTLPFNEIGDELSLADIETPFFVAGSTADEADKIYKINPHGVKNQETFNEIFTEVAWLSGQTIKTDMVSYVAQRGFNALFNPGTQTKFLWTGPNDTSLDQVFPSISHRKDCPLVTDVPKNASKDWRNCSCKQVYYAPYGHNMPTFQSDTLRRGDYIIDLDTLDDEQIDLNSWKDIYGNVSYNSPTQFAWYKTTTEEPGWGQGKWVTNYDTPPFKLQSGKTYLYFRHGSYNNEPPLISRFVFPQTEENKTVWISSKLDKNNQWESTNLPSTMSLAPGDIIQISPSRVTTFNILSTFLDPNNIFASPNSFAVPGYTADLITRYSLNDKESAVLTNPSTVSVINGGGFGQNPIIGTPGPNQLNNIITSENCQNIASIWSTYDLIPVVCFKQNGTTVGWPIITNITDLEKNEKQIPILTGNLELQGLEEVLTPSKIKRIRWVITDISKKTKRKTYVTENTFTFNFVPPTAGIYQIRVQMQLEDPILSDTPTIPAAPGLKIKTETKATLKSTEVSSENPVLGTAETTIIEDPTLISYKPKPSYKLANGTATNLIPVGWDKTKPVYIFNGIPNIVAIEPVPFTNQGTLIDKVGLTKEEVVKIINTVYTEANPLILKTNINFRKTKENIWDNLYLTLKTLVGVPRPGFLVEEQLYGWDYTLNKRRPKAKGSKPYWASLDIEKTSTTRYKAIYDWGYPDKYVNGYLPNNQPEFSHLKLNNGDVVEYHRKGTHYTCTQLITPYKFVDRYRWCKIEVDLTKYSNLSTLFKSKQTFEPIAIPTYENTDIILADIVNTHPLGIYYYSLGEFIWNIKATPLSANKTNYKNLSVISENNPGSPWENLANRFYPNIAMAPLLQNTYTKKDVGGFFTPNNLGLSVFVNKNFTTSLKPISASGSSYVISNNKTIVEGMGTTKQTQPSIYTWEENNEWMKEPVTTNELAGMPKRSLTKTMQTLTPYEANTAETSLGVITLDTKMSPWGGKDNREWVDKENKTESFTGILNVSAWNNNQITKEYESQTEAWISDVYGNQYQLLKKNTEDVPFADRKNVGGTLWIKTNAGRVVSAQELLSGTFLPLESQIDLINDSSLQQQMLEMDCFYNVLFVKTPTAAAYFTLFYSYETDSITTTADYTNVVEINNEYRFEKNWFLQNEKKIISLFTHVSSTSFVPELWETDLQTLDRKKIYPSNQAEKAELIDALLEIDIKDLQPGCMSYNKDKNVLLLTYVGNNLNGSLVVVDFTIQRNLQSELLKIDYYTNLYFDSIAGLPPQVQKPFLRELTVTSPFVINIETLHNPTQCSIVEPNSNIIATISNPNIITFTGSLPQGVHQIVYELSNLVGSIKYPLTLNVV